jgi:hypothetical protein
MLGGTAVVEQPVGLRQEQAFVYLYHTAGMTTTAVVHPHQQAQAPSALAQDCSTTLAATHEMPCHAGKAQHNNRRCCTMLHQWGTGTALPLVF